MFVLLIVWDDGIITGVLAAVAMRAFPPPPGFTFFGRPDLPK
jgi:hypothetical protein